ncbi:MAG: MFS transporter, partial [Chloroflexi bacterium]
VHHRRGAVGDHGARAGDGAQRPRPGHGRGARTRHADRPPPSAPTVAWRRNLVHDRRLRHDLVALLTYRGATTFLVGLSYVAFALPATLLSGYAGSLGDRFGARRFIVLALFCTAFFAALYPFIASVPWLIGLGLIEGIFTISGVPSTMAEVSRNAEPGQYARTQAVFQTVQTGIQIVGALAGGALFTISPVYAFLSIAVVCVLGALTGVAPRVVAPRTARESS